jgi:pSer/pThr/pTyr-binding forkhead associated (FHA) protein
LRGKRGREKAHVPRLAALGDTPPRQYRLLKRKLTIGSDSENDIVLADPTVSRRHALLRRRLGRYRLIDLESTNGTFVNGRRIGPGKIRNADCR